MISRRSFVAAVAPAAAALARPAFAAPTPRSGEVVLGDELNSARWPADIARAADRYLVTYPQGPSAETARAMLEPARRSARALDRNVRLYRSDFRLAGAADALGSDIRKAALGDNEAALRVAHAIRDREQGADYDVNRYVGWLQFASALGNAQASYELALYYRKDDQPALAAPYELRAEELGFQAPRALDNIRK